MPSLILSHLAILYDVCVEAYFCFCSWNIISVIRIDEVEEERSKMIFFFFSFLFFPSVNWGK